jgi:predicted CXXCH cytochrome family protein
MLSASAQSAVADNGECLSCHAPDTSAPMQGLVKSAHGGDDAVACSACHGESAKHVDAPNRIQPVVSFGPRWTSSVDAQNGVCLECHGQVPRADWPDGPHAEENLTCINCHDAHVEADPVLAAANQSPICTQCHAVQREGMHQLHEKLADNPPCVACHEPHDDPSPGQRMLANRSEGCRACHQLETMQASATVSSRAKSYHKVMRSADRTCIDCHRSVAHVDYAGFAEMLAGGFTEHAVGLFYPGTADRDWLISEHGGAQALRQGQNCRQCHFGETAAMGEHLAPAGIEPSVEVNIAVALVGDAMELTVEWQGDARTNSVAVMMDDGSVEEFSDGGCWASCHSDMPGMSRDRGQGLEKYLVVARRQQRSVGRPPMMQDTDTLSRMRATGEFAELWRAVLNGGNVDSVATYAVLDRRNPANDGVTATGSYANGRWRVVFRRPLADPAKPIVADKVYTFGVAIHGDGKSGAQHWVSLPLTFGLDGLGADFSVR